MGNWFLAAVMGCSLIALSAKFAVAQNGSVERDERIGRYLEAFSTELGLSVDQVILGENIQNEEYSGWGEEISDEIWGFKSSQPGDFGFVARNKDSGDIVAVFNHDAPTYNSNGSLEIAGYDQGENVEITTVSGEAWDEAQKKVIQGITDKSRETRDGRTIDDVALKASQATMTWAARLCPKFVYPSRVTLFLDAGFDFVVVNTQTGTQIEIVMEDACNGLEKYLKEEARKRDLFLK